MAFAGANKEMYLTMQDTPVPMGNGTPPSLAPTGARVYLDTAPGAYPDDGIPAWDQPYPDARICTSIRPELWKLINGEFDGQLQAFLTAAPGGATSLVALWHEASSMGMPGGSYYTYFESLDKAFPRLGGRPAS